MPQGPFRARSPEAPPIQGAFHTADAPAHGDFRDPVAPPYAAPTLHDHLTVWKDEFIAWF